MNQPDRIPSAQVNKIENVTWLESFRTTVVDGRTYIEIRSDLKLEDIPLGDKLCIGCHEGLLQREIVEWEQESEHLIVSSANMPGYGCTGCAAKSGYAPVAESFYEAAFKFLEQAGDLDEQGKVKEFQRSV